MTKKIFIQTLFFGSLWGILEATLGHVLHFIPATIAGAVMFPIAGAILYKAYNKTESIQSLFYIGIIAAMIKSVDLLLPQLSIYKTINPMISILMESLVVVLVMSFLVSKNPMKKYSALIIASVSWRSIFVLWMYIVYLNTGMMAPYLATTSGIIDFVIITGLLSGVFASGIIFVLSKVQIKLPDISKNIIFASSLLLIALFTTYTL